MQGPRNLKRSQKILEKFLKHAQAKHVQSLEKIQAKRRTIENFRKDIQKKKKIEETQKQEEEKELKEEKLIAQKNATIQNPQATFTKILKHLQNPKKQEKCAKLLKQFLMAEHGMVLDMLSQAQVIGAMDCLIKIPNSGTSLQKMYEYLLQYYTEAGFQDNRNDVLMQIWYIPVYLVPRLKTDDSFDFNSTLREFKECVNDLCPYSELEVEEDQTLLVHKSLEQMNAKITEGNEQGQEDVKKEWLYDEIQFDEFVQLALRYYVMKGIEEIYNHRLEKWALTSITLFLKQLYINKEKFNERDQERLGDMLTGLKSKSSATAMMNTKRALDDEKLKSNPLQNYHSIADGRGTSVVVDGLDSWDSKQLGLSGK